MSLNLPGTQAVHGPPSGPVYPPLQEQLVRVTLPRPERVYPGQSLHVDSDVAAVAVLYLP